MIAKKLKRRKMHASVQLYLRSSPVKPLVMLMLLVNAMAEPIKLHPIGDSTTEAYELESAWRYWLYKKLVKNGYENIDFVGSRRGTKVDTTFTDNDWDMDHDGHLSSSAAQILNGNLEHEHEGCIKEWALKFTPHIAVIYLGVNDIRDKCKTDDIIKIFEGIIQALRDARNEVKIVVCQIPYWSFGKYGGSRSAVDALNDAIPSLKDLGTEISPIKIVNLNRDYDLTDLRPDGIHPGPTGAVKIADRVYDAIVPWLKITAIKKRHVINHPGHTSGKTSLRLTIQNNMPARVWISVESGSDVSRGQGYLITGRKITVQKSISK